MERRLCLGPTPNVNRGKEEGKEAYSLAEAGLPSYLYRLLVMCVHLSVLEVVPTPPQAGLGDELYHCGGCLDDYNLGKAMCGEAVSTSPALSRATPTPATAAIMS
jgi:hypothetical protein